MFVLLEDSFSLWGSTVQLKTMTKSVINPSRAKIALMQFILSTTLEGDVRVLLHLDFG